MTSYWIDFESIEVEADSKEEAIEKGKELIDERAIEVVGVIEND